MGKDQIIVQLNPDDITKYGQVIMAIDILLDQYLTHSEKKSFYDELSSKS